MDQSPGRRIFFWQTTNVLRRSAALVVWGALSVGCACRSAAALHPRLNSFAPTALIFIRRFGNLIFGELRIKYRLEILFYCI